MSFSRSLIGGGSVPNNRGFPCLSALLLSMAMAIGMFGPRAHGGTIRVTSTQDTTRATSLRGAVIRANGSGTENTIILPTGTYLLTIPGADEDAARTGDLDITRGNLTIMAEGTNVATIDATGLGDRVFHIWPNAQLTLRNLIITGGSSPAGTNAFVYFDDGGSFGFDLARVAGNDDANGDGCDGENGGGIYNAGRLTLQNCIIIGNTCGVGGEDSSGSAGNGGDGGGIYNSGQLILDTCIITGNYSGASGSSGLAGNGGNGGGICNDGTATMNSCIVSGNFCGTSTGPNEAEYGESGGGSGGNGGGIYNTRTMVLNACTISDNAGGNGGTGASIGQLILVSGSSGGLGGNGGGIYNAGELQLNTCTMSGNSGGLGGGGGVGIVAGPGGEGGNGGGMYNTGSVALTSCTFAQNSGGPGGTGGGPGGLLPPGGGGNGGAGGNGGGIFNATSDYSVRLRNTLVALNLPGDGGEGGPSFIFNPSPGLVTVPGPPGPSGSNGSDPDLSGDFTSGGHNLIGEADGSTGFTNRIHADLVGEIASPIDPLLGPLQMNGGPTPTQALLPGSPAIDKGNSFGLCMDQRGYPRPHSGGDIGAFELEDR
jgi:hypothetical protein